MNILRNKFMTALGVVLTAGAILFTSSQVEKAYAIEKPLVPVCVPESMLSIDSKSIYLGDSMTRSIYKVYKDGKVELIAGKGGMEKDNVDYVKPSYKDGKLLESEFATPGAMIKYKDGLLIADYKNHVIRYMDLKEGKVMTAAGTGRAANIIEKGIRAGFDNPRGLAIDEKGLVYIADTNNNQIKTMDEEGNVSVLVGLGDGCVDGGYSEAKFSQPTALSYYKGMLYVADTGNDRIVRISLKDSKVKTIAGGKFVKGSFVKGSKNTERPTTASSIDLSQPRGVLANAKGVYIADSINGCVRLLKGTKITTIEKHTDDVYPMEPLTFATMGKDMYFGDVGAKLVMRYDGKGEVKDKKAKTNKTISKKR